MSKENDLKILQETIAHWQWLEDNPSKNKEDYPPAKNWAHDCGLCAACGTNCSRCIMTGHWAPIEGEEVMTCESFGSAYLNWKQSRCPATVRGMLKVLKRRERDLLGVSEPWMTQDLSDLKVGDDVYCLVRGPGKCYQIDSSEEEPFYCKFEHTTERFYTNGFYMNDLHVNQSLFKGKHHPFNPQPNPLGLRVGDKILVRDFKDDPWQEETFHGYISLDKEDPWRATEGGEGSTCWEFAKLPEPLPKTVKKVKSAPEIMQILVEAGYRPTSKGDWVNQSPICFNRKMFVYCGEVKPEKWDWEPEWLEEFPELNEFTCKIVEMAKVNKIAAIKAYRGKFTGLGLREAKEAVETLVRISK